MDGRVNYGFMVSERTPQTEGRTVDFVGKKYAVGL
jgi:hypothetical protein